MIDESLPRVSDPASPEVVRTTIPDGCPASGGGRRAVFLPKADTPGR